MHSDQHLNSVKPDGKQRLLNAARVLFAQGGIDDASVADILEMSNLKAPSLYHHYGDKEGLYTAWALDTLKNLGSLIDQIQNPTPHQIASTILSGSTLDILQIQRDLRSLQNPENVQQIDQAIQDNLISPVADCLAKFGTTQEELPDKTNFFLHSIMYVHPAYSLGRKGTNLNGQALDWILSQVLPQSQVR